MLTLWPFLTVLILLYLDCTIENNIRLCLKQYQKHQWILWLSVKDSVVICLRFSGYLAPTWFKRDATASKKDMKAIQTMNWGRISFWSIHQNQPWYCHSSPVFWLNGSIMERECGGINRWWTDDRGEAVMKNPVGQREVNEPCLNSPFGHSFKRSLILINRPGLHCFISPHQHCKMQ